MDDAPSRDTLKQEVVVKHKTVVYDKYMVERKPPIPVNTLDLRPQWAWQTCRRASCIQHFGLFFVGAIMALWLFSPFFIQNVLLWGFSLFVICMACLRILALLITIKGNPSPYIETVNAKWPTFTILVSLYQEAHMVDNLIKNLLQTNYPHNLLDIVLVVEQDDEPTCRAVKRNLPFPLRVFEVPLSEPRTKPKALNAALEATPKSLYGDIITVYDAEDRPHPDQIRQAALAFMADSKLAVVQAPLGYFNDNKNLLTALFGLEYAALFHVWNPALARLGLPFTL